MEFGNDWDELDIPGRLIVDKQGKFAGLQGFEIIGSRQYKAYEQSDVWIDEWLCSLDSNWILIKQFSGNVADEVGTHPLIFKVNPEVLPYFLSVLAKS